MRLPSLQIVGIVAADLLLLAVSMAHIPTLIHRPRLSLTVESVDRRVVVRAAGEMSPIAPGDVIVAWEGTPIHGEHDLEFLSDFRQVGDQIGLTVEQRGQRREVSMTLVPAYPARYVIITTIVGVITWCVGVFVVLARPRQQTAGVLHWSLICMGMVTMLMLGHVEAERFWPYLTRSLFFLTYAGVAAFFLHFTFLFPIPHPGVRRTRVLLLYLIPGAIALLLILFNLRAIQRRSLDDFDLFTAVYDVFHIFLLVYVVWGITNFVRAYRKTIEPDERKKLKWLLWGLTIGPVPFLALITIPEFFVTTSPVPEEIALLALIAIPVSFAISFVRYHVMDVEIVIQRTTVYAIVLGLLALAYAILVWFGSWLLGVQGVESAALAAVAVGLAFEPARRRIQHWVDRRFFQVRYDFRQTERRFVEEIRQTYTPAGLATAMVSRIEEVIPVERIAFVRIAGPEQRLEVLAGEGFEGRSVELISPERRRARQDLPLGVRALVEGGVPVDDANEAALREGGVALVFPMSARDGSPLGLFMLGKKRSGARFAAEDIDLLSNLCAQASLVLERLTLHGALVRKQTEAEHLHALNEMKSEFVSNVSHELRTPLTSIKLFTEMLKVDRLRPKEREYLEIIQAEAGRLDRLVSTVLDAALIERGAKTYTLRPLDLTEAVHDAFATMEYQLKANGFTAFLAHGSRRQRCMIEGDRDAVVQAVINLIGNAIKYSITRRRVRVAVARQGSTCRVSVADRGEGITRESKEKLFQRFFREPETQTRIQGFGIGLAVVKHIMDAHGGSIEIESTPGRGSTFTLVFPVLRTNEPRRHRRRATKGHR